MIRTEKGKESKSACVSQGKRESRSMKTFIIHLKFTTGTPLSSGKEGEFEGDIILTGRGEEGCGLGDWRPPFLRA